MLRPIRNEEDYETALEEIEELWNSPDGTAEADRLDILVMLVEAYEAVHYPIPDPDPIALILHVMEAQVAKRAGLTSRCVGATVCVTSRASAKCGRGCNQGEVTLHRYCSWGSSFDKCALWGHPISISFPNSPLITLTSCSTPNFSKISSAFLNAD